MKSRIHFIPVLILFITFLHSNASGDILTSSQDYTFSQNSEETINPMYMKENKFSCDDFSFIYPENVIIEVQGLTSTEADETQGMIIGRKNGSSEKTFLFTWTHGLVISQEVIFSDLFGALSRYEIQKGSIFKEKVNERVLYYQRYSAEKGNKSEYGVKGYWYGHDGTLFTLSYMDATSFPLEEYITFFYNFRCNYSN